ncbi:MAG: hypothetical protein J6R88_00030 [Clostridia bacterium]|nr:hypothetical protein [Clostridia bacterium]
MLITYYDAYSVLTKVYSNGAFIKQAFLDTVIEEKNRSATTKICYGVLDKDITLSYVIKRLAPKTPKLAVRILLKIALYSIIYLKAPSHAVINTTVELIKKLGKGGTSGFVNATLRNYLRNPVEIPTGDSAFDISIRYSCPEFIVNKLILGYGLNQTKDILSADTERTFIRFNKGIDGEKYLLEKGKTFEKTPFDNVFYVKNFKMDGDFYEGIYTFQSVGSVAICNGVLHDKNNVDYKNFALLDACSAPGGKAVYLSDYFSTVTACDVHEHRVSLINSYASRMNKGNVTAILSDATVVNENFIDKFNVVLVDAPCSGTGVIKDNPDIKLNRTENSINELTTIQKNILNVNAKYVKKGGYLCYSTCSLLREENDGVIKEFLKNNTDFSEEVVESPLSSVKLDYGLQFLPNLSLGAGFYFVKLKRN